MTNSSSMWGDSATQFFHHIDAHQILHCVDACGFRSTGRVMALNSMENRVYEVEIENEAAQTPSERFVIIKFYRPGRWSKQQILEEHQFLLDLVEAEVSVIAPIVYGKETLFAHQESGIWFAIFPKKGGRMLDELNEEQLLALGRSIARIHLVGSKRKANHRLSLNPDTYGRMNLQFMIDSKLIPSYLEQRYRDLVLRICDHISPWFENTTIQRIHGDCHRGNVLWPNETPFFVDFDDMVMGPPVQDLWPMVSGRDQEAIDQRNIILEGYDMFATFDYSSLRLIEPLRALRFIHFSAWIGKRFDDESFKRAFAHFGTDSYWNEQFRDLSDQWDLIQSLP